MKPRLHIHVRKATHFLSWELPYFERYFDLIDSPAKDAVLFSFGPDALASGALLPAYKRVSLLFPGFGLNPYHDIVHRYGMQRIIDESYDLVFVNPGPIREAFRDSSKIAVIPFSVNTELIHIRKPRNALNSLLHVSAFFPQKDWTRSRDIMKLTGLRYEVFPPRELSILQRVRKRVRIELQRQGLVRPDDRLRQMGYVPHSIVVEKYHAFDGFVHVAAETPPFVDGKYTATLLEAGLTGCILFWHDTLNLGNDFETIFNLPLDPQEAAAEILHIRQSIDVESHSRRTAEEIFERTNPNKVMRIRYEKILEMLQE